MSAGCWHGVRTTLFTPQSDAHFVLRKGTAPLPTHHSACRPHCRTPGFERRIPIVTAQQQRESVVVERADPEKSSPVNLVTQTVLSPFTAAPIALGAVGAYAAGYGLDGAALGMNLSIKTFGRLLPDAQKSMSANRPCSMRSCCSGLPHSTEQL